MSQPDFGATWSHWWRGETRAEEVAFATALAVAYAFCLACLLVWLHPSPLSEAQELRLYVIGWPGVPALACLATLRVLASRRDALPAFAAGNALAVLAVATLLRIGSPDGTRIPEPGALRLAVAWAPLAANLLALVLPGTARVRVAVPTAGWTCAVAWTLAVLVLALPGPPPVAGLAGVAIAAAVWAAPPHGLGGRAAAVLGDVLLVGAAAWLLFDPHLHYGTFHYNGFLGPVNDMLRGGTVLADVQSQYGVAMIPFLAAILGALPVPLSYPALSAVLTVLLILQYALIHALLRHLHVSVRLAGLALVATFLFHFIGLGGAVGAYPSLGPLRFGFPWLLLVAVAVRTWRPAWRRASELGEALLVAIASLWSFETFLFAAATWTGVAVFEALGPSRRAGAVRDLARRTLVVVAAVALAHALFAAGVRLRAGVWPDWVTYLALVQGSVGAHLGVEGAARSGFANATRLFQPTGPWLAPALVLLGSLLACLLALPGARSAREQGALALVFGATVMGVGHASMYVGISSPERLASVSMAPVFVAAFWISRFATTRPRALLVATATGVALLPMIGRFGEWLAHDTPRSLGVSAPQIARLTQGCEYFPRCLVDPPVALPKSAEAERLVRAYAEGRGVLLLLGGQGRATTEVLMRTERRNGFPLNAPFQDAFVPRNADRVASAAHTLEAGDIVIAHPEIAWRRAGLYRLERRLRDRVCSEFHCRKLPVRSTYQVMRLESRTRGQERQGSRPNGLHRSGLGWARAHATSWVPADSRTRPSWIRSTRSAMVSSAGWCEIATTVVRPRRPSTALQTAASLSWSSPAVASSRISRRGRCTSARAIAMR